LYLIIIFNIRKDKTMIIAEGANNNR